MLTNLIATGHTDDNTYMSSFVLSIRAMIIAEAEATDLTMIRSAQGPQHLGHNIALSMGTLCVACGLSQYSYFIQSRAIICSACTNGSLLECPYAHISSALITSTALSMTRQVRARPSLAASCACTYGPHTHTLDSAKVLMPQCDREGHISYYCREGGARHQSGLVFVLQHGMQVAWILPCTVKLELISMAAALPYQMLALDWSSASISACL